MKSINEVEETTTKLRFNILLGCFKQRQKRIRINGADVIDVDKEKATLSKDGVNSFIYKKELTSDLIIDYLKF